MTKQLIIRGIPTHIFDAGKGPVVLMLHGWGSHAEAFAGLASALSSNYRVVRVDLPGFGATSAPPSDWSVGDYARWIAELTKKLDITPNALVGHSFGGRIILKAVGRGLLKPERVVLLAAAGVRPTLGAKARLARPAAKVMKPLFKLPGLQRLGGRLRRRTYQSLGATDYLKAGTLRGTFRKVISEDLREDATQITVPTLLIWGEADTETPLAQAHILGDRIANARLEVVPKAGHYVFLDAPDKVNSLLKGFFA